MPDLFDNRYRFIRPLGFGGFGQVFLAEEEKSHHLVAIKQLHNKQKNRQDAIVHEMQIIARFNHPNIAAYKHYFIQDDLLYIVMEYCSLGSLRNMMKDKKTTSTFIWKWMDTLTQTLQFVHEKKIIHHDIKPDNILFSEDRIIKISDFGVANTDTGTTSYMSPEALSWDSDTTNDERIDIYALGVTLLELLTGENPFRDKSVEEILALHDRKDFGITHLPNWQQEIILKAIAKIPEQRFQNMKEFNEAIQSRYVPIVFDKEVLRAGKIAEKAGLLLKRRKWSKAIHLLDYAEKQLKPNVNVFQLKGKFHLLQQKLEIAQAYYEKALIWNPRLDIQKELGWINLERKNIPTAISLLSDHLHRNPSDYEGYNLLLQCFFETNRYELAADLAKTLLEFDKGNVCFENNYYISQIMQDVRKPFSPEVLLKKYNSDNPFIVYNTEVVFEPGLSHNFDKKPTLKSKLLFMDYRFKNFNQGTLFTTKLNSRILKTEEITIPIVKIGREHFGDNDLNVPGGTAISRRHCLIVNCRDDIWLYDLDSTGTFLNGEPVNSKAPLVGKNILRIGNTEYEITNDKTKLL
ncbi:MAG: protein kinase [Prolixibacteraceae bacterium]|nr:protein kinase [Prolixibacteraceae bacterium]